MSLIRYAGFDPQDEPYAPRFRRGKANVGRLSKPRLALELHRIGAPLERLSKRFGVSEDTVLGWIGAERREAL